MSQPVPLHWLTLLGLGWAGWMIYRHRDNLWSLHNLFWVAWLYYGFSVGVDLAVGAPLPLLRGEVDLSAAAAQPLVARVMGMYFLCGAAYAVAYHWGRRRDSPVRDCQFDLEVPPIWLLALAHLVIAYFYANNFFGVARMTRAMLSRDLLAVKLQTLSIPLLMAADLAILIGCERSKTRAPLALGVAVAMLTGHRVYVAVMAVTALMRYRPRLTSLRTLAGVAAFLAVLLTYKTTYAHLQAAWRGERVGLDGVADLESMSLSGLDAYASSVIGAYYLRSPSPYWGGWSYVVLPLQLTWPRFLGGSDVSTLAEMYVWRFHTEMARSGGGLAFSALAEAWLNFGVWGGILLGGLWGLATRWCDARPRGPVFYLAAILTLRLFRSDFASLYKTWVVVWGAMFCLAVIILVGYSLLNRPAPLPAGRCLPRA